MVVWEKVHIGPGQAAHELGPVGRASGCSLMAQGSSSNTERRY